MADITGAPSNSTTLRWTTLIVIVASIAFVAVYSGIGESPTITELITEYGNLLVPAGFAKVLGLTMLVAFLFFYGAALLPSSRRRRTYDKLVMPLVLSSVLAVAWTVALRHEKIGLSVVLVAAIFALAGVMFSRAASASPSKYSHWLRVPFSLHFAAMTLALLIALTHWLGASGARLGPGFGPEVMASAFLAVATVAAGFAALRYRDFVYPTVIAAAAGAIFVAQRVTRPDLSGDALTVCVGMLVVAGLAMAALEQLPRRVPKYRSSHRGTRVARHAPDEPWYPVDGSVSVIRF